MHIPSINIRMRIRNILLAVVTLAAIAAGCPVPALSFEVIVVKNADLKPYQEALQGIRDSCDCDVREMKLQEDEGVDTILKKAPDAVVAVGTSAFKKVRELKGLPVIYTMVMPSEIAGSLPPNISGVSMDSDPMGTIAAMTDVFPKGRRIGVIYDPSPYRRVRGKGVKGRGRRGGRACRKTGSTIRARSRVFWTS